MKWNCSLSLAVVLLSSLDSALGTTFTVTDTADTGLGTLRQAILDANADASLGIVNIEFNIPGSGVQTIAPLTPLPAITRSVTIDGYTQPGASPNTLADADNAVLLIELNGANLSGESANGLFVTANDCAVRGLVFNRFSEVAGILLFYTDNAVISGNFFGTDAAGLLALGNSEGIVIYGAKQTQLGGLTPAARNIFCGNSYGIDFFVGGVSNQVLGNFIGVGADGATTLPNRPYGIFIHNSEPTQIGGITPAARNVISGNTIGIWVNNFGSNVFQGNFIGTDASGTMARGNISGLVLNESPNNLIGGTNAGAANLISGNLGEGVDFDGLGATNNVLAGNLIGTDITGTKTLGNVNYGVLFQGGRGNVIGGISADARNVITGCGVGVGVYGSFSTNNTIFGNSTFANGQGIDLGSFSPADLGPTPNDASDADDGANHYQNFPEITSTSLSGPNMSVDYGVDSSAANSIYPLTVEFFIADAAGQGRTFIHRATYSYPQTLDHITFVPAELPVAGDKIVATATDANGNTSEFLTLPVPVTINPCTPPTITCPANLSVGCSAERLATVSYPAPTVTDDCDAHPTVTCTPASGSASFAVGVTTVVCTAFDALGNRNTCSFTVTRAAFGFAGFLPPIGGEVSQGTGGSFAAPVRAFKLGSTIPVKFISTCGGSPIAAGIHTLQAAKYSSSVSSDPAINATPTDAATTGNQFRLTDAVSGEWHFNLDTKPLSAGIWKLTATLSDGSMHEVWVTIKK